MEQSPYTQAMIRPLCNWKRKTIEKLRSYLFITILKYIKCNTALHARLFHNSILFNPQIEEANLCYLTTKIYFAFQMHHIHSELNVQLRASVIWTFSWSTVNCDWNDIRTTRTRLAYLYSCVICTFFFIKLQNKPEPPGINTQRDTTMQRKNR